MLDQNRGQKEIKRDKRVPGRVAQRDGDITRGGNLKL